jgi:hypothetical protein
MTKWKHDLFNIFRKKKITEDKVKVRKFIKKICAEIDNDAVKQNFNVGFSLSILRGIQNRSAVRIYGYNV